MSALPTEPRVRVRDDQATRLRAMLSHNRPAPAQPEQSPEETQLKRPPMIAVASGKGGVGKTFTSVSLATALAAMGRRITLIDADFGAGLDCTIAATWFIFVSVFTGLTTALRRPPDAEAALSHKLEVVEVPNDAVVSGGSTVLP